MLFPFLIIEEDPASAHDTTKGIKAKTEPIKEEDDDDDEATNDVVNTFTLARDYRYDKENSQWCQLTFAVSILELVDAFSYLNFYLDAVNA